MVTFDMLKGSGGSADISNESGFRFGGPCVRSAHCAGRTTKNWSIGIILII